MPKKEVAHCVIDKFDILFLSAFVYIVQLQFFKKLSQSVDGLKLICPVANVKLPIQILNKLGKESVMKTTRKSIAVVLAPIARMEDIY